MKIFIAATSDLYAAAAAGDLEACKSALDRGAEAGRPNPWQGKYTPLHMAAAAGSVPVCELFLARGAELDPRTSSDETPCSWLRGTCDTRLWIFFSAGVRTARLQSSTCERCEL